MEPPALVPEVKGGRKTGTEAVGGGGKGGDCAELKVRSEGEVERYCICHKSSDEHQQYIQCEDECNWYHPMCIGFGHIQLDEITAAKFVCPVCDNKTLEEYARRALQGEYDRQESQINLKKFNLFIPPRLGTRKQ